MSTKVQCDLCRLSYSTEKELLQHKLSLMHHTKLDDRKKNPLHECQLCSILCSDMADYRRHLSSDIHQKNLSDFEGVKDRKNDICDSSSWSDDDAPFSDSNKKQCMTNINSYGAKVLDQYSRKGDQLNKNHQNGSHLKLDPAKALHVWDRDSWESRYHYRNDLYHWSRDDQELNRDLSIQDDLKIPNAQKNSNFHSGAKILSGNFQLNNSRRYSEMGRWKKDEELLQINRPVYSCDLDDPCNMDFTSDVVPTDWDENSFLEHEQFLHGVDTMYHQSDRLYSNRLHPLQASKRTDVNKWEESSVRDRKRPRNEDDVQELLAKSSRSFASSSDEYVPVRDVPRKLSGVSGTHSSLEVKPATNSLPDFKRQTEILSIDNASNNILERAERLCKELRQKREASEAHKNLQLTKQNHEPLNQKMSALSQEQQMDHKTNIVDSNKFQREESYNSSAKQVQDISKSALALSKKQSIDSDTPEMQARVSNGKLSSVKKSVEKRIVEDQKTGTNISGPHRPKQRSLSGGDTDLDKTKKCKDVLTDVIGKPILNPVSKLLLNKDNLKKMVNTPNSRDERLQMVKMLHSRMEQKTATSSTPRTHLQLEGMYDSVFATHDVDLHLGKTFDSQMIKLENLSEGVRQQILDLIGSDVSNQPEKHARLKSSIGIKKTPLKDVIILSDDEELRNLKKNKKNAARKMSGCSASSVSSEAAKTNKKKKIIITKSSFSKVDFTNSDLSLNSKSSIINQSHNSRPTSPVLKSNKLDKDKSLHTAKTCILHSPSSDLEHDKAKGTSKKENAFPDSSDALLNSKRNSVLVNSIDCKHLSGSGNKNQSQFDSYSIREKFPTLLKISKTDRVPPVQNNGMPVGSSTHSSQNSADKSSSPTSSNFEADIKAIAPKIEVKPSLTKTDQETLFTSASAELATLETKKLGKNALHSSTWLTSTTSPLGGYESQHMFTSRSSVLCHASLLSEIPAFSSAFIKPTFKNTPSRDLLLLNNMDHSSAVGDGLSVGEGRTVTSDISAGTPSQTMTTLLMLSEKEEYVKQEKMSMDLRLSRLHKLLEQAVVQISKCTERMNKLHEEEQELLKRRLSLLRDATSLQPSRRYDVLAENNMKLATKPLASSETHGADFNMTHSLSDSGTRSFGISQSSTTNAPSPVTESGCSSSLSKADWLAKFASFLPQGSVTEEKKITSESISLANISALEEQPLLSYSSLPRDGMLRKLNINKSQPERDTMCETADVEINNDKTHMSSFKPKLSDNFSQVSSSAVGKEVRGNVESHNQGHSANPLPVTGDSESVIHSLISAPIMYVGSFRSTDHSMRLISPFVLERSDTRPLNPLSETSNRFGSDSNLMLTDYQGRQDSHVPTHDSVVADLMHLPSPSRSHSMGKSNEFGGEESDIGSVASSMASGGSLGEQITQYCRSTPGASLDSRDPYGAHELSVIMSDASEQKAVDSSAEEENNKSDSWLRKEPWEKNVKSCSISLERLDRKFSGIYGSLDEKSVRSAEALHLIERNCEDTAGQPGSGLDSGKRRKRKTKQERDTAGFTQRRSHWITVSSSEDEGSESSKQKFSSDMDIAVFRAKKSGISSSFEKSDQNVLITMENNIVSDCEDVVIVDHWSPSKEIDSTDVTVDNMKFLSPSKSADYLDLTVAECDSSTSMGAVDSESNFQHIKQKEMRKNFDQLSHSSPKSSSPETYHNINSCGADTIVGRIGSRLSSPEHLSSLSCMPVSDSSLSVPDDYLNKNSARRSQSSKLPIHSTISQSRYSENDQPEVFSFDWKTLLDVDEETKSDSVSRNSCRFPGSYGLVFDIQVVKGHMYVGHCNRGVRVYSFSGLYQSKVVKEYSFIHLQCMTYKEHDDAVTLILGSGSDLVFCNSNQQRQQRHNLGTTIKCLLLLTHLVYAGLDTGEVCKFDTLRMVLKDRCICSDHPIHCLAAGKEGAVKLLCVSSQDGTIIVVDAQQFLPIRILRGHSKTAFSIQVEGDLVFSGSGDHTVLIQNLHTAEVEHVYSDSKGLVKSICYYKGHLFTGGMDKLVRCYDVKSHKLVQVYYGADRGVVTKILVHDNMLFTGNISGSVDIVEIDIGARHRCHIAGCSLIFGNQSHLLWHRLQDHSLSSSLV